MKDYFTRLLGIQGFVVEDVTQERQGLYSTVTIDIKREQQKFICDKCGYVSDKGVEYRTRTIQHLMCWQHRTYLRFFSVPC